MPMFRRVVRCLTALAIAQFVVAGGAKAQRAVDLELVLAVDVSLSMDQLEQALQREGYVAAFRDPAVLDAIASGPNGAIAVTYVEWAGAAIQQVVVDWTVIASREGARAFADRMAAAPISRLRMTSISGALSYSASLFATNLMQGMRRVIDISGDGPNNSGAAVAAVRDRIIAKGISINGLPVMLRPARSGFFDIANLDRYYERCVIGGPGAFVVAVRNKDEFGPSIRRKLILEISGLSPLREPRPPVIRTAGGKATSGRATSGRAASGGAGATADCRIGERLWQRYMDGGFDFR